MGFYLGIDTSNYTTSAALYDSSSNNAFSRKMLLPVKKGEKGIRQSDAVFHHTAQLPSVIAELFGASIPNCSPVAIGVSDKPSNIENSYMPCFSVGVSLAESLGIVNGIKVYRQSHQHGHIASALWSADRMDVIQNEFIAFHISGGTTEAVLCTPDKENIFNCRVLLSSSDLKAGQAVDRVGVMLGLPFPAGKMLDVLSLKSERSYKIKPSIKNGCPSLSGVQNKCEKMFSENEAPCDIAKYCIEYISAAICAMTENLSENFLGIPIVCSGGVLSNTVIRNNLSDYNNIILGKAEFSSDNAVGAAVLACLKDEKKI